MHALLGTMDRPADVAAALAAIARLAPELAENAARDDENGALPARNLALLREAGLLALPAPREAGGLGLGLADSARVIGGVAEADPSAALILAMQFIVLAGHASGGWSAALRREVEGAAVEQGALINALRVEPELGTPLRGGLPATTARRTPDGWRLSGRKIYSTGAEALRWGIVWARTDEPEPRVGQFLVPLSAPGIRIETAWNPIGMRATASHDVVFEDTPLAPDAAADLRRPEDWTRQGDRGWNNILLAAIYDGVSRAAHAWTLRFLNERVPSNLGAPLASLPRVAEAVGAIEQALFVNRRLLAATAARIDDLPEVAPAESALVKLEVTEAAIGIVERHLRLAGNHGLSRANPLERHYRNVLCGRVHSPQQDTVHLQAGRAALDKAKREQEGAQP